MIARNIVPDKEAAMKSMTPFTTTSSMQQKVPKCANVECHKVCIMSWQICMQIWQTIIGAVSIANFSPTPSFSSC